MLVSIDRLKPDSTPVRRRLWEADDASLRASIAELGVLEPLLVIRLGDDMDETPDFEVKDGNRRLAAARACGLMALEVAELPRKREDYTLAAATAANIVRAPLDPVDQWRAIVQLQERGYDLSNAARCLGLTERHARQLDKLGRLHPDMLRLMEQHGLPPERTLAAITTAPHDIQHRAATDKRIMRISAMTQQPEVNWHEVYLLCQRTRFPRAAAIFDVETAGLHWDQDWFAQPGSAEEWTAGDAPGFLKAQRAALEAEAAASKGRLVVVEESKTHPGDPVLPKGWRQSYTSPDKPKRGETVFATISSRTGAVVRITATNPAADKAKQKEAEQKAKAKEKAKGKAPAAEAASAIPSAVGTIETPIGGTTDPNDPDEHDTPELGDTSHPGAAPAKPPMTKEGQKLLAGYKTAALRARLRDRTQPISNDILVPLLVLALHADNVSIMNYERADDRDIDRWSGTDLARRLVTPAGQLQFDGAELPHIAAEALARVLSFSEPDGGSYNKRSGPVAEWIAAAIDAQAHMPRLDTAEFLATLAADKLKNAAVVANVKFTTATAAKRDLPGKLPSWRPDYTHFGAPGPKPAKEG